jgi:hypothetical protein
VLSVSTVYHTSDTDCPEMVRDGKPATYYGLAPLVVYFLEIYAYMEKYMTRDPLPENNKTQNLVWVTNLASNL